MPEVIITCPQCVFTRKVPAGKVPKSEVRVVCPRCSGVTGFALIIPTGETLSTP